MRGSTPRWPPPWDRPELQARLTPPRPHGRDVLVQFVARFRRSNATRRVAATMHSTRGAVITVVDDRSLGKFSKVNDALDQARARGAVFKWFLVVDDDVALPPGFLDTFLDTAEAAGLVLAQPAHRIHSYATYAVTQRAPRSFVRATRYVEGGPVVAFHHAILPDLLPFPELRHGWGADFLWSDLARRRGWRIGVVDAAPCEHLRPVAGSYSGAAAMHEARLLLAERGFGMTRHELLHDGRTVIGW